MESGDKVEENRRSLDVALLAVRIVVGIVFMAHGSQKLFGAFQGPGPAGTVESLGEVGYLVMVGEFFGGAGILLGFLSRFSAFWITVIMVGAIVKVHAARGFFLSKGGFEFNLALIGLLICILIVGPGKIALGRILPLPKVPGTNRPILFLE